MATNLGQAYVQIMPSARGIKGSIQKQLDPEAQSAGGSAGRLLGGKLVGALAGIVAAAKIGEMIVGGIKASISEGAALQQSLGGIETLFKNNANKVKAYAKEAYRTTGLSANAYMENVTGFSASLLQSLGGDTSKAADVANMAMIDMSDNANKMGTSMELIQNAYQGFAKQNYTMLDNLKLGYGGTKEEMQRLLSDAEKLTGQKYDISNLSDVYNAIHAIQGKLDITGTTAKEASSTFTGSFTAMKSAAQNLLGHLAIGESITDDLKALASTTSTFLFGNFLPMVRNILKGLPTIFAFAIKDLFPKAVEAGKAFLNQLGIGIDSGTSQSLAKVKGVVESLINTIKSSFSKLNFDGVKDFLDSILPALSAGFEKVATKAGPALESVITSFTSLWNAAQPLLSVLSEALLPAFEVVGSFLGGVFSGILSGVAFLFDALKIAIEIFTPVISFLVDVFKFLSPILSVIAQWIGYLIGMFAGLGSAGQGLGGIVKSSWKGIQNAISTAKNIIGGAISYIKLAFSGAGKASEVLKNILSLAWMAMKDVVKVASNAIKGAIGAVKSAFASFGNGVKSVGNIVKSVIQNIKNVFNSLKNIDISGAGSAIMNGFLGGLKSAWGGVQDFVGGIAGWIKDHKGPIDYDAKLLIPAGKAIMNSLHEGLANRFKVVKKTVSDMATDIVEVFQVDDVHIGNFTVGKTTQSVIASSGILRIDDRKYSNDDVFDILSALTGQPVVVSVQLDKREIAQVMAEPMADRLNSIKTIKDRLDGKRI